MQGKSDNQLFFDFAQNERSLSFKKAEAVCKCGCPVEASKASIVIEMIVLCPQCKSPVNL